MACEITTLLTEGVDYEFDQTGGRIRFLSTGALGPTVAAWQAAGGCSVVVEAQCADASVFYSYGGLDYSCDLAFYVQDGYDTAFQEGAEDYRSREEKMIKRATLEAEPLPQSTPSPLECDVGFGNQPNCMTWRPVRPLDFECQTAKSDAQHTADMTRPDDRFHFPTWLRGKYLSVRFRVTGIGGGGMFSALHKLVRGWGQHDAP
jgi:hypothetical protein